MISHPSTTKVVFKQDQTFYDFVKMPCFEPTSYIKGPTNFYTFLVSRSPFTLQYLPQSYTSHLFWVTRKFIIILLNKFYFYVITYRLHKRCKLYQELNAMCDKFNWKILAKIKLMIFRYKNILCPIAYTIFFLWILFFNTPIKLTVIFFIKSYICMSLDYKTYVNVKIKMQFNINKWTYLEFV